MTTNPLHLGPIQPLLDDNGRLANPIGGPAAIHLDPAEPIRYEDLLPSTTYTDTRFEYLTDQEAMPARVRGCLQQRTGPDVIRHPGAQADVGHFATSLGRWQGGHLLAVTLGGFASGPNLFPQSANFNQSAFARLENGWRKALRDGTTVALDIALTEGSEPRVPEFVIVTYWESDELQDTIPLLNEPNAQ